MKILTKSISVKCTQWILLMTAGMNSWIPSAHAVVGFSDGGGGYMIQCPGLPVMALDYYEATLPSLTGTPRLLSLKDEDLEQTKRILLNRVAQMEGIYKTVLERFSDIFKTENWIEAEIEPGKDDTNTPYQGCVKFRVAHRQSKTVYLKPSTATLYGAGQLLVLGFHEWFYAGSGDVSSEKVRHVIRELLKVDEDFDQARFARLMKDLLSRWQPLMVRESGNLYIKDLAERDEICRANGAEFSSSVWVYLTKRPFECGLECYKYVVSNLTCAKLGR